jgi:hypothetical protein
LREKLSKSAKDKKSKKVEQEEESDEDDSDAELSLNQADEDDGTFRIFCPICVELLLFKNL